MAAVLFFSRSKDLAARKFSNFAPAAVEHNGVVFPSIENAFQAAKYLRSDRPELFRELAALTPAGAKSAGSRAGMKRRGATLDVDAWNAASVGVMKALVDSRMRADAAFRHAVEAARRDGTALLHFERAGARSFWGGNFPAGGPRTAECFAGKNVLGKILMGLI